MRARITKGTGLLLAGMILGAALGCGGGEQPVFTQEEFSLFMADALLINTYMLGRGELYGAVGERDVAVKMRRDAHQKIKDAGWDLDRFYYIYRRCLEFGTYLQAKNQTEEYELTTLEKVKFGRANHFEAQKSIDGAYSSLAVLRERLNEDIPVSERVFLYERGEDILRLLNNSAIHFLP